MTVYDAYNDPYQQKSTGLKRRREFEKLKKTTSFIAWRKRQLKVQTNKCAYCLIPLTKSGIVTHIDHVTPLRFDGTNDYSNFVLSCRRCNMKKWVATNRTVPDWITLNDKKLKEEQKRRKLIKDQEKLAREIIDQYDSDLLSWIV